MLPLMINTLPQNTAPQPTGLGAGAAALLTQQASSATRQIMALAISGPATTPAYNSQLPERREAQSTSRTSTAPREAAGGYRPSILPDAELWRVPEREAAQAVPAPLPERAPLTVNLPQISQFTAQALAQRAVPVASSADEASDASELPATSAVAATGVSPFGPRKQPALGTSRGASAYALAAQRNAQQGIASTVQALS